MFNIQTETDTAAAAVTVMSLPQLLLFLSPTFTFNNKDSTDGVGSLLTFVRDCCSNRTNSMCNTESPANAAVSVTTAVATDVPTFTTTVTGNIAAVAAAAPAATTAVAADTTAVATARVTDLAQSQNALQDYVNKFKQLLRRIHQQADEEARQQLNQWVVELQALILVIPLLHPGKMYQFGTCRMSDGCMCSEPIEFDVQQSLVSIRSSSLSPWLLYDMCYCPGR